MPEYNITELVEELKSNKETNTKIKTFLENIEQFKLKLGDNDKITKMIEFIENQPRDNMTLYEPGREEILNGMNCILDVLSDPKHFNKVTNFIVKECENVK